MYDTGGTRSVCQPSAIDYDVHARLSWLGAAVADFESGALAQREAEECAAMRMRAPLDAAEAYGWFGLLLGLFPPAALFCRLFLLRLQGNELVAYACLCVVMLAVCCAVGRQMSRFVSRQIGEPRRYAWPGLLLVASVLGAFWGLVAGGAGGAAYFGVGALAGAFFAVPVGAVAFPAFALLHRQVSRSGMIEEGLMWPLAFGVPAATAAAILGM